MFEGFEAVEWNRHERRRVVIGGIVLAHDLGMMACTGLYQAGGLIRAVRTRRTS